MMIPDRPSNNAADQKTTDHPAHAARPKDEHNVNGTTYKSHDPPDCWEAEFVAAYFVANSGRDISAVVAHLCDKLDVARETSAEQTVRRRVQCFADTVLPRRSVAVQVGHAEDIVLGPSSASGISCAIEHIGPPPVPGRKLSNTFAGIESGTPYLPGLTAFAEPEGWGLISDIDDTIKVTQTYSPLGLLKSTFIDDPCPVTGMPELYRHIRATMCDPATFYVSASPYNLYPFLRSFRDQYYPHGTMILRDASWQNLGGLVSSLREDVLDYKVHRLHKIHHWLPRRKFICIGDSTQKDPESYGQICRVFSGWVRGIFIRKVTGVSEVADPHEDEKNSPERFQKAFEGLDKSIWYVFTDPREVARRIDEIVAKDR